MADPWAQFQDAPAQSSADPWAQFQDAEAATQDAPVTPEQPQQRTGDIFDAFNETAMSLGSGTIAMPVAGLAGLGATATRAAGLTDALPGDVVRRVQEALTYQPRTKAGEVATETISYPFEKLAQAGDWAGQKTLDVSGSPAAATAVSTAVQSLPALLTRRGGRAPARVEPNGPRSVSPGDPPVAAGAAEQAPKPAIPQERPAGLAGVREGSVPTRAELAEASQAAYKRADEAGVVVSANSLFKLKTRVASMAKREGIDKDLHPDSSAALRKILETKGQKTLTELETLRKVANDASGSIKPADKRLAGKIVDELDDYMENLGGADVVAGDASKVAALKEARSLYSRAKKSDTIARLMDRAETKAGAHYTQAGMEHALRGEFKALALNEKELRRFSKAEQEAIKNIARGGKWENSLRNLGKFDPTSGGMSAFMSTLLAGGGAVQTGGASLLLPAAAYAAKRQATRITSRKVSELDEMVRRGPAGANALARETAERKRNALADF